MSENRVFYVYEHWRPDTGECFYVGKGKGRRAWKMRDRNSHHTSIVSKLTSLGMCVDVRIISSDLSECDAFTLEATKIAEYGRDNLANLTDGGEGLSGLEAWNRVRVTCLDDLRVFESIKGAATFYGISAVEIGESANGLERYASGLHFICGARELDRHEADALILNIELKFAKRRKRKHINKHHGSIASGNDASGRKAVGPRAISKAVICVSTGQEFYSASEAARVYNVSKSAVIELCLGKNGRKTVGGMVFKYKDAA